MSEHFKKESASTFKLIMGVSIVFGFMVFYVWQHLTVESLARDIEILKKEKQTIINTNEQLRSDASKLSSYGRIKKIATEELGLVFPPEKPRLLVIQYDKNILDEESDQIKKVQDTKKAEQLASENP